MKPGVGEVFLKSVAQIADSRPARRRGIVKFDFFILTRDGVLGRRFVSTFCCRKDKCSHSGKVCQGVILKKNL